MSNFPYFDMMHTAFSSIFSDIDSSSSFVSSLYKRKKNRPNVGNLNQSILIGHELKITLRRRLIKDELRSARECFSPE